VFARRCFCDHNHPQPLAVAAAVNDRSGGTITVPLTSSAKTSHFGRFQTLRNVVSRDKRGAS